MNTNFDWIQNKKTDEWVAATSAGWYVIMESVDRGFYWMHNGNRSPLFYVTVEEAKTSAEQDYYSVP